MTAEDRQGNETDQGVPVEQWIPVHPDEEVELPEVAAYADLTDDERAAVDQQRAERKDDEAQEDNGG